MGYERSMQKTPARGLRAAWLRRPIAVALLALALGCASEDATPDAGLADARDAQTDAGPPTDLGVEDAGPDDAGAADTGPGDTGEVDAGRPDSGRHPPDSGIPNGCGCAFGFHHECDEGQMCAGGFTEPNLCWRAEPAGGLWAGGCTTTATSAPDWPWWAPCNATCVPLEPACQGVDPRRIEQAITAWRMPLDRVLTSTAGCNGRPCELDGNERFDIDREAPDGTCGVALGWSVLGVAGLCGGVPLHDNLDPLSAATAQWRAAASDCDRGRIGWCLGVLGQLVRNPSLPDEGLYFDTPGCPELAPSGPCRSRDCVRRELRRAAATLRRE